ncbi:MAG: hypothetical protein EOO99_03915 [Pedobacter sp.]|nr:MAG: hypothetical protein EOO99_03915 [Pedobacter sp.]
MLSSMRKGLFFRFFTILFLLCCNNIQAEPRLDTLQILKLIDSANIFAYTQTDKSINFAKEALNLADKQRYTSGQLKALMALSKSLYVKGIYDESLKYSTILDSISRLEAFELGRSYAVNNRGLIYLAQDNYIAALQEFKAAIQYNQQLRLRKPQAANYFNIALCHIYLKEFDAAEVALKNCIAICKETNDQIVLIMALNRYGEVKMFKGLFNESIAYFNLALAENKENNTWEKSFSYNNLGKVYFEKGFYSLASQYGLKSLNLAEKLNAKWDRKEATALLYQSYEKLGDFKLAFKYLAQNKLLSDSLLTTQKEQEISRLMLIQKQNENEELKSKLVIKQQRSKLTTLINFFIFTTVIVLSVFSFIVYRQKKETTRLNTELAEINHSKDQLFSVIAHDLRSPILSIVQTVDLLRTNDLSREETQMILDKFFERISATASMLENLLLWAQNQRNKPSYQPQPLQLPNIVEQVLLLSSIMAKDKGIIIKHTPSEIPAISADPQHLLIIFQNLLSNAIKFTPPKGNIWIDYSLNEGKVNMEIKDSGVGIPAEKVNQIFRVMGKEISTYGTANEKGIGIGLMLVKKYADENNIAIEVESNEHGTRFNLQFKTI